MKPVQRAYLELHIAIFLFGFTAILGDLIQLSALVLVWWRVLITSASLLPLVRLRYLFVQMPRRILYTYMGIGVVVGLHWIAFYSAIKWANASIALVCMATTSFFTSIIEPWVTGTKFRWYELMLGALILPGMFLIVDGVHIPVGSGIAAGITAAFLAAMFAIFNKKMVGILDEMSVTFVELSSAWLFLSLLLPVYLLQSEGNFWPTQRDWGYLLGMAIVCTTMAYVLALRSLRQLSAFASNLSFNLEPVYGILMAWLILREDRDLSGNFYWGMGVILISVFLHPLLKRRLERA